MSYNQISETDSRTIRVRLSTFLQASEQHGDLYGLLQNGSSEFNHRQNIIAKTSNNGLNSAEAFADKAENIQNAMFPGPTLGEKSVA